MATTVQLTPVTGKDAGLSGDDQIRIALREMVKRGGRAVMGDLYAAVEAVVNAKAFTLSEQARRAFGSS